MPKFLHIVFEIDVKINAHCNVIITNEFRHFPFEVFPSLKSSGISFASFFNCFLFPFLYIDLIFLKYFLSFFCFFLFLFLSWSFLSFILLFRFFFLTSIFFLFQFLLPSFPSTSPQLSSHCCHMIHCSIYLHHPNHNKITLILLVPSRSTLPVVFVVVKTAGVTVREG